MTAHALIQAAAARREAAILDLEHIATERPESATEHIETLNRFLLAGGDLQQLRRATQLRAVPADTTGEQA